jgi:hypothetical protein
VFRSLPHRQAIPEPDVVDDHIFHQRVPIDADLHVHVAGLAGDEGCLELLLLLRLRQEVLAEDVEVVQLFQQDQLVEVLD